MSYCKGCKVHKILRPADRNWCDECLVNKVTSFPPEERYKYLGLTNDQVDKEVTKFMKGPPPPEPKPRKDSTPTNVYTYRVRRLSGLSAMAGVSAKNPATIRLSEQEFYELSDRLVWTESGPGDTITFVPIKDRYSGHIEEYLEKQ